MAKASKPNILVIFGDDIGMWNVGVYANGMMGTRPTSTALAAAVWSSRTTTVRQVVRRGAAFLMGQVPLRTGMTTIGIPGSRRGIQKEDPSIAEVLKSQGYATGQFGKNHQGDRNEFLPTVHGFDEWFGNLYHLNSEEELDYPGQKNPEYTAKYGPRGVLHSWATDVDNATEDPVFGRVGRQKIENTGKLTRKRMETFDSEVLEHTLTWLDKVGKGDKPFFCWFNTTAMLQAAFQAADQASQVGTEQTRALELEVEQARLAARRYETVAKRLADFAWPLR